MGSSPMGRIAFPSEVTSIMPPYRINSIYPVVIAVAIMIRDEAGPSVSVNGPVEVVENEVSGEPETGVQEWVRDP